MNAKILSPEVEANLRELRALGDDAINFEDMPEVTDFSGFRRATWRDTALLEMAVPLEPELRDWFRAHSRDGMDWRETVNGVLRDYVANAKPRAA